MSLLVSRLHYPVTALGPGIRAGIWVQGCSIGCRGCMSRDTWDPRRGHGLPLAVVMEWLTGLAQRRLDGVTISGGEPFDQPDDLELLLLALRGWTAQQGIVPDVLCYSGYTERRLRHRYPRLLESIDAIISGPYREDLPTGLIWRGSANQRLVPLTELGYQRFGEYVDMVPEKAPIQAIANQGRIWTIGVPPRGGLQAMRSVLTGAGVGIASSSWDGLEEHADDLGV